jgi:GTP cyclohydrolase I
MDDIFIRWLHSFIADKDLSNIDEMLKSSPTRITDAHKELLCGYSMPNPEDFISNCLFPVDSPFDGTISSKNISYISLCKHHYLPITGKIDIVYIPNKHIVGTDRLSMLATYHTRRLTIQESIAINICMDLHKFGNCNGVYVKVTGTHFCTCYRKENKEGIENTVVYRSGIFKNQGIINNTIYE